MIVFTNDNCTKAKNRLHMLADFYSIFPCIPPLLFILTLLFFIKVILAFLANIIRKKIAPLFGKCKMLIITKPLSKKCTDALLFGLL